MRRNSWAYAVTAVMIVALQTGWAPADVTGLAVVMLVLIAFICAARDDER